MLTIFCAGIIGTTIMTGFSHVVELLSGHKFNEAHLLNQLIGLSKTKNMYDSHNVDLPPKSPDSTVSRTLSTILKSSCKNK